MIEMEKYYRLSGKVSPAYAAYFVTGAVLTAALSVLYAIGMFYIPSVYLSVLVTILFAAAAGFIAAKAAEWGQARNAAVWGLSLLAYFAIFTYVHLTAYAAVVFRATAVIDLEGFWSLLKGPSYTYRLFTEAIIPYGVWSFTTGSGSSSNASAVSGGVLVGIWVIEHLTVLGGSAWTFRALVRRPFFEETKRWGVERVCDAVWEYQPEAAFAGIREALESGRLDYFRSLKPAPSYDRYCRLSCYADAENAHENVYLSLTNSLTVSNKKGKAKTTDKHIVRHLIISETSYRRLEAFAKEAGREDPDSEERPSGEAEWETV
ncbi:MAG: hypothetical protein LBH95_09325 [Oscillospiraceae bacterium]|jgi:hypothetical protein|nr:hypothetical protein [Oscillospiraceae bacterium]